MLIRENTRVRFLTNIIARKCLLACKYAYLRTHPSPSLNNRNATRPPTRAPRALSHSPSHRFAGFCSKAVTFPSSFSTDSATVSCLSARRSTLEAKRLIASAVSSSLSRRFALLLDRSSTAVSLFSCSRALRQDPLQH